MREDIEKFNLEQDLQDLKTDIDKLGADVAHLMWKSTVGRVEYKIAKRPFSSLLYAFAAGVACCLTWKIFRCKR
jgi:hypothetical protein